MQAKAMVLMLIAIVIGGVAAYLVYTEIKPSIASVSSDGQALPTQKVVVAAADLEVGMKLDRVMLKLTDWPVNTLPKNSFSDIESAVGKEPRVILKEMREGEIVLQYKVSPEGARAGLTPKIPEKMRAITISVNEIRGVAGFVLPGDYVDLLLTSTFGNKNKDPITKTLLQNIAVLGVAQESSEKKDDPKVVKSVTLLVTPKQSQVLTLAQTIGSLTLVLRNEGDQAVVSNEEVKLMDLLGAQQEVEPAPKTVAEAVEAKPVVKTRVVRSNRVEVIRGLKSQSQAVKPTIN